MKPLTELNQGEYVEYIHNTGKIKKGFTIGKRYPVMKIKKRLVGTDREYVDEFTLISEEGIKRTFKTSSHQFKISQEKLIKPEKVEQNNFPELNKMGFADLLALRTFINEEVKYYQVEEIPELIIKWECYLAIVQQHIDKSTAHYFDEESKS